MPQKHDPTEDAIVRMQRSEEEAHLEHTDSEESAKAALIAQIREQMPERQRVCDAAWEIVCEVAYAIANARDWPVVFETEWTVHYPVPQVHRSLKFALPFEASEPDDCSSLEIEIIPFVRIDENDDADDYRNAIGISPDIFILFITAHEYKDEFISLNSSDLSSLKKELSELIADLYDQILKNPETRKVDGWSYTLEQFVASLPKGFSAERRTKGAKNLEVVQDDQGVEIRDRDRGFTIRVPFTKAALSKGDKRWSPTGWNPKIGLDWGKWAPLDEEGKVPVKWARKINDHLAVEAHAWADDAYLVIVRGGNRLRVDLDEAKALIEVLNDEAARLAGVVAGDVEPGGGGNGGS